jgi:hypothetical protein
VIILTPLFLFCSHDVDERKRSQVTGESMPESISNTIKLAERGELRLLAFCQACGHGTRLDNRYAVRVIEGYATLEKLSAKMRCTKCSAKECLVDWAVRNPRK